ncbi:MAG: adenylate/guanylate cyclase domain-containing protein [Pseudomonadota bacterium]
MSGERRQTIRRKFLRVTIPLIFLTVIGVFSVIELMTHRNAIDRLNGTLDGMVLTQSAALATPLWNLDHDQIRLSLEAVAANQEIITARIYGEDGAIMLEVGENGANPDNILLRREVIYDAGAGPKAIGNLELVATSSHVWEQTRLRLFFAAMIAILAVSIEVAAALFALKRIVAQPLNRLLVSINKSKSGQERDRIEWQSSDELGQVIAAFNDMQDQQETYEKELRDARDTLERRVEDRTAELLSATKESARARSQLTAAIETISEGFSLYDRDDRLVICNSRYQELLRPEVGGSIEPGTRFEAIVRNAADNGLIADAEGRLDEWIQDRIARHQSPGEPHLQHRKDGRWILISERKTEDGGTVAVYADITELKQREEELAKKSSALEQLSNQLAKYLSPQVYESIFRGKQEVTVASDRKKLTVFFSDIADFTETADKLQSEELTHLLNHYLNEMSQIALAHGATIDKYVGDAILIFFGDPESRGVKEDALACVKMAIAMREKMESLQWHWRDSGIEKPLRCRMGIHTDYCTVGNFGSEDRLDYTIIGGGVNTASRLETSASPGDILISYETYSQVKDQISCQESGTIKVKGLAYPVITYQVIDSYENLGEQRCRIKEERANLRLDLALDGMTADERNEAVKVLKQALQALEDG